MRNSQFAQTLQHLEQGELSLRGLVTWGSNYTFLADLCVKDDDHSAEMLTIYKPRRGERPLWDFSSGSLCQRERAAFVLSEVLNWHLVPPTILREGPHGIGSLQLFIEHDPDVHYFNFEGDPQFRDPLQQIVLFDIIVNNADRKGGHILLDGQNQLWAIDHGICFHDEYKLRTVVWEFAGEPIPDALINDIKALCTSMNDTSSACRTSLQSLITRREIDAIEQRAKQLLATGIFPHPGSGRPYPWPLV